MRFLSLDDKLILHYGIRILARNFVIAFDNFENSLYTFTRHLI